MTISKILCGDGFSRREALVAGVESALVFNLLTLSACLPKSKYDLSNDSLKNYPLVPSDYILKQYIQQNVDTTIRLNSDNPIAERILDNGYEEEIFQPNLSFDEKEPAMVLFYNNMGQYSRGTASLAMAVNEVFDIRFYAYRITGGVENDWDIGNHLRRKYPLTATPALLFYNKDKESGNIVNSGKDYNLCNDLMSTVSTVKKYLNYLVVKLPETGVKYK